MNNLNFFMKLFYLKIKDKNLNILRTERAFKMD